MQRGLTQKIVYGYNPLPKVTEQELIRRSKLELLTAAHVQPFGVKWQYSGGAEREDLRLEPGSFLPLRENPESLEFMVEFRELGLVLVVDKDNRREVIAKSLEGLRVAQRHYSDRGAAQALKMGRDANRTREQVEGDFRYDYYPYFLNQAKAEVIAEEVKKLQAEAAALDAPPAAAAPTKKVA